MSDGNVIGMVSIGDLVKSIIANHEFTIDQLTDYIGG
jgi:IMP dehydrogenase